jgi:hypothetical protein
MNEQQKMIIIGATSGMEENLPGCMYLLNTHLAKVGRKFWVTPVEKAAAHIYKSIQKKKKRSYITRLLGHYCVAFKIYAWLFIQSFWIMNIFF